MPDVFSKEKRSEVMSRIKGKGNKTTEMRMVALFRENGVKGWRRHFAVPGRPDFAFRREKVAVFVDGCFWHRCPRCYSPPRNNAAFWEEKITANKLRDKRVARQLRGRGWAVLRVWECSLRKRPDAVAQRVIRTLSKRSAAS